MSAHYTHSRSVLLCFGGWGLQTLMHTAPRIQAAQEQRASRGKGAPDLNRITSYGAVLPQPLLSSGGLAEFTLSMLQSDKTLPPFYIERILANIANRPVSAAEQAAGAVLTDSERRAMALQQETESVLDALAFEGFRFRTPVEGVSMPFHSPGAETGRNLRRATRRDMMLTAAKYEDPVSRLVEAHLVDPVRQDTLSPDDPFVQTTLYVVAPLFEPLASALLWPIVAGMMQRIGRRHLSTVVGVFATGSYALDRTRPVEDGGSIAALAELEVLTGIRDDRLARHVLEKALGEGSPALLDQVGQPLFDHIYLLDREKNNQGLAEDSHELAVLAGNALEGFITGSADSYVEEQLGYRHRAGEQRPYSLLGAAGDYVPVQQLLHAVNRQEESRLVREWVLRNSPDAAAHRHPLAQAIQADAASPTLREMGLSQRAALAQLALRMPGLFSDPEPERIQTLSVRRSFVFSPVKSAELRTLQGMAWPDALDEHMHEVRRTFGLAVGPNAVDEAWGLSTAGADAGLAFQAGLEADGRMVPQLVARMHRRVLDQLSASPTGLLRAHAQTVKWLHEAEESLQRLEIELTPSMRELENIRQEQALHEWQVTYREIDERSSSLGPIALRAGAAFVVVALIGLLFALIAVNGWNPTRDGMAIAGLAVGLSIAGLATYRLHWMRMRRSRLARVDLAQAELTTELQRQTHDGFVRLHKRLINVLQNWEQMLQDAIDELRDLSTPPDIPAVPPAGVFLSYLYTPYFSQSLWDRCLSYLRTRLDMHGQRSEERLDTLWGEDAWRQEMERLLRATPASHSKGIQSIQAHTIAEFIRQTVRQSVAPVSIQAPNSIRSELIRALADEFSIEYLLWRGRSDERDIQQQLRAMGIVSEWDDDEADMLTDRRYVESAWNRAKPTANYDVADRLAVNGVTVDFAAAAGSAESGLTRALLDEFNVRLLPTENPFTILFVRTVHGLALGDLDCIRRYRMELRYLPEEHRRLVCLDDDAASPVYAEGVQEAAQRWRIRSEPIRENVDIPAKIE